MHSFLRMGCKTVLIYGSLFSTIGFVSSHFATSLSQLLLTFGFITGTGMGLCVSTLVVTIYEHYGRKSAWPMGFASSGIGFGNIIFPPLTEYALRIIKILSIAQYWTFNCFRMVVSSLGWRHGLLIMSIATLIMLIFGIIYKSPDIPNEYVQNKALWNRQIFTMDFFCLCLNNTFFLFGHVAVMVHLVNYVSEYGIFHISNDFWIITIVGVANLFGRIGLGILSHAYYEKTCFFYAACNIICSLATLVFTFTTDKVCKLCNLLSLILAA